MCTSVFCVCGISIIFFFFFFFKQKTAYEMRISDWSSDVCSSDLWLAVGTQERMLPSHVVHEELEKKLVELEQREGRRPGARARKRQIGRASCRERVCQYV